MTMTMLSPDVAQSLAQKQPFLWLNPAWRPIAERPPEADLTLADIRDAERRLRSFSKLLAHLFPELASSGGIIESPLYPCDALRRALLPNVPAGRWLIKADHALPVAGSIKARGGLYEVLLHAERLALQHGLLQPEDERVRLASAEARRLFADHEVIVGSTGNLGLSIGVMAAALGFRASVHMSADAKQWKKQRLRARGVGVIEHEGDFGSAVAAGREQARSNPRAYFVDDENSRHLFLGYAAGAVRLQEQLAAHGVTIDERHPLFVYLPCGVGGAPGGLTFALRHLFGDHVHCFFAEPTASACMLVSLAAPVDSHLSVAEVGLDNRTEADGLAVAKASAFVVRMIRSLVSGVFTAPDDDFFEDLYVLERTTGLQVEPSAVAAFRGPGWLLESQVGRTYLERRGLAGAMDRATHMLWTTGGAFLPADEYQKFHDRGRNVWHRTRGETATPIKPTSQV